MYSTRRKKKIKLYYIILNKNNAKYIYCIKPTTKIKNKLLIEKWKIVSLYSFILKQTICMFLHVIPFNKYNKLGIYYMKYILTSSLGLLSTNACLSLSPLCIQEEQDVTLHKYYKYNVFSWDTLMWHCFLPVCLSSILWNL